MIDWSVVLDVIVGLCIYNGCIHICKATFKSTVCIRGGRYGAIRPTSPPPPPPPPKVNGDN